MGEGTVPSKAFADLTGRRAVVTGAGVGLGRAIAYRLHQQGARVAVADVDRSAGEETKKILGRESMFVEIDVGRDDLVAEGFAEIFGAWGEHRRLGLLAGGRSPPRASHFLRLSGRLTRRRLRVLAFAAVISM